MTDRELLELAAKAAGLNLVYCPAWNCMAKELQDSKGKYFESKTCWNPLTSDGDALRLAVTLGISLLPYPVYNENNRHSVIAKQKRSSDLLRERNPTEVAEVYNDDPYAATRRAIVRAAAEIGRNMK